MFVRRRPLLRAAVVGGGAYMIGKRSGERAAGPGGGQGGGQEAGQPSGQAGGQPGSQAEGQPGSQGGGQSGPPQEAQIPHQVQAPPPAFDTGHEGSGAAEPAMTDQLAQLARLHDQGALSDAEFARAKARLLGG